MPHIHCYAYQCLAYQVSYFSTLINSCASSRIDVEKSRANYESPLNLKGAFCAHSGIIILGFVLFCSSEYTFRIKTTAARIGQNSTS